MSNQLVKKGMEKVVIGREAYDKIQYYVNKTNFEISGFGNVEIIDGIATVTDIILLEQENTGTETDIKGEAIAKALYEHEINPNMNGELKFWWHSHANMNVFWSGQDEKTKCELTENGWWIHGVFNHKGEHRISYTNNEPFNVEFDNLKLEIDEYLVSNPKLVDIAVRIMEKEAEIAKMREDIDEIEKENQEILAKELDPIYEKLVTEKVYVYNQGFTYNMALGGSYRDQLDAYNKAQANKKTNKGGTKGKLIPMSDLKTTSNIGNNSQTSSDLILGEFENMQEAYLSTSLSDFVGAVEIYEARKYKLKEIEYLQAYCGIWNMEDLLDNEEEFGSVDMLLNGMM